MSTRVSSILDCIANITQSLTVEQQKHVENKLKSFLEDMKSSQSSLKPEKLEPSFRKNGQNGRVLAQTFESLFGFSPKDDQLIVIEEANDSKVDILTVLPSGYGKSAIYQTLSYLDNGLTIVVFPLLSIIEDQLKVCNDLEIPTIALLPSSDNRKWNEQAKILLCTPENLLLESTQRNLEKFTKVRLVVDEAHCVLWYNFRSAYEQFGSLAKKWNIPILALTATASKNTQLQIVQKLGIEKYIIFEKPVQRNNIVFYVLEVSNKFDYLVKVLKKYKNMSGIIYCTSIKQCCKLYQQLENEGFNVGLYHGELPYQKRSHIQEQWLQNKLRIVIATVALGLGVNKQDVRFVIHYHFPQTLDTYTQQCGRAGRDGKKAVCIFLYSAKDLTISKGLSFKSFQSQSFYELYQYCITSEC